MLRPVRRAAAAALGLTLMVPLLSFDVALAETSADVESGVVDGEMLVRFASGTPASERSAVRARNGLQKVRDVPIAGVELVRVEGTSNASTKARRIGLERSVEWAEPNRQWSTAVATEPDDPDFAQQWGLHNTGENGSTAGADIGYLDALPAAADTSGIVVAVLDTGTDITHPDLVDQIWTNTAEATGTPHVDDDGNGYVDDVHGWDWWHDDASVYDSPIDDDHGTHVAGTIAATTGNALHVTGVSDARIMPLKFIGPEFGDTAAAVLALDYAMDMGADIVNASWGGPGYSHALAAKIAELEAAGVIVVAAAGNGGTDGLSDDNDATPAYPASYPNANVVSVAATDENDDLAWFSNYGATSVDLGAPGVAIVSTLPGGRTGTASGTSMAAPHASGVLAHVLAAYPKLTPLEATAHLLARTQPVPSLAGKTVTGGRLDLALALNVEMPPPTLRIMGATSDESDKWTYFTVALSGPYPSPVTVLWSSGADADTATAVTDYVPVTDELLTFQPGETRQYAYIWLEDDTDVEDDETVSATLSSPTGATIGIATAVGSITSDDRPIVSVAGPATGVGEADGHARFTVTLSTESLHGPIEVGYATVNGTATAGEDYTTTTGTLRFDGTTSLDIDVPVISDTADEPDRSFSLTLSSPVNAVLGTSTASATIVDDDEAAVVADPPSSGGGGTTGDSTGGTAPPSGGGSTGGTAPTGGGGGGPTAPAPTTEGEPATESSDPEGTVPTAANPLVATASGPTGPITLSENAGSPVTGHAGLGHGVEIHAPDAPADDPLVLTFDVHVPDDVPADAVVVARNGVAVTKTCTSAGVAAPDPCEASRSRTGDTLRITVNSTRASQWDLAVPSVLRLAGADRIATSIAVSAATWGAGQARSVVLSRADAFPDALAGGALAATLDAPLLLTSSTGLPSAVATEIRRVLRSGGTVHLLGGTSAIGDTVADQLRGLGYSVDRISGADRFATATAIAARTTPTPSAVLVTTGTDFPDALAASAAAGHVGGVVVLTDGGRLPEATRAYLASLAGTPIYAVGGPAAAALADAAPSAVPLVGPDRYATSALVAERFFDPGTLVGIATGQSFPDALAAGARLGRAGGPLLLAAPTGLTTPVASLVGDATRVELYGGTAVLSDALRSQLAGLLD